MATITNAIVRVAATGQAVRGDCFGNNASIECPTCLNYPVLLVALPNQRGASAGNPSICRRCGATCYILDSVAPGELAIVNIAAIPPAQ
jgi:hypothetical protein